jgi:aromatase
VPTPKLRTARHAITVAAAPERVYRLIADVRRWPQLFSPTVHTEHIGRTETEESVRIWALANGEVRDWTTRRELDPAGMTVAFRQQVSSHPVLGMGGVWQVYPDRAGARVELLHDYRIVDDDEQDAAWVARAVDRNSTAELGALREMAQAPGELDELWLSFADSVEVDGDPEDVYQFLARAQDWPHRLGHVARLDLDEEVPDVQHITMDTVAPDGSVHTTSSVRVCFPSTHIVYKQTRMPGVLTAHTGRWTIEPAQDPGGPVVATAHHTVVLKPEALDTVDDVRTKVRAALGGNSLATLRKAKEFAESRRPIDQGPAQESPVRRDTVERVA